MIIRELTKEDYQTYKSIRLELLENHPENFGSSYEEESKFEDQLWINRITKSTVSTIGAFQENEIVGICVLVFNPRQKMKHISSLHSMYVKQQYRQMSIGRQLLEYAIDVSKKKGLKRMNLSVVDSNKEALQLYEKLKFRPYGIEPDTIKLDDKYYSLVLMSKKLKE